MGITIFSATREHTQWSVKVRKDGNIIELTYPLDSEPELSKILADAESLPEPPLPPPPFGEGLSEPAPPDVPAMSVQPEMVVKSVRKRKKNG